VDNYYNTLSILINICNILGVIYDEDKLNSFKDYCEKVNYLLFEIYKFLGGK